MADWMDWLEGISGAASGTVKGLTEGMKPFDAWEKVRTQDLANDLSDVKVRDAQLLQSALEGLPDYYGNLAGFRDVGNRKGIAQGEYDIYGIGKRFGMDRALSDPFGDFQQSVRAQGLGPQDVGYRQLMSDVMGQYDPFGAIAAYDKLNIPGMQQANVNEQAVLSFIQQYAQMNDPTARVVRYSDGTLAIESSEGVMPISGDMMAKAAAMLQARTPYDAISKGLADEGNIIKNNAVLYTALTKGQISPAQYLQGLNQIRQNAVNDLNKSESALQALLKSDAYKWALPDEQAAMRAPLEQRIAAARNAVAQSSSQARTFIEQGRGAGGVPAFVGPPSSLAGSTVTTRPQRGAGASRAAGSAGPVPDAGRPVDAPQRAYGSPRDTGVRPITNGSLWGMP